MLPRLLWLRPTVCFPGIPARHNNYGAILKTSLNAIDEPADSPDQRERAMSECLIDRGTMLEHAGHDEELVLDLIHTFLQTSADLTSELQTSQAAGDLPTLARAAHTLKSPLGFFGANSTVAIAQSIESHADGGGHDDMNDLIAQLLQDVTQILSELRTAAAYNYLRIHLVRTDRRASDLDSQNTLDVLAEQDRS